MRHQPARGRVDDHRRPELGLDDAEQMLALGRGGEIRGGEDPRRFAEANCGGRGRGAAVRIQGHVVEQRQLAVGRFVTAPQLLYGGDRAGPVLRSPRPTGEEISVDQRRFGVSGRPGAGEERTRGGKVAPDDIA